MKKRKNAYFTVEAAMVMPIVVFVIVWLLYLALFQYNRCLMEQDVGWLALKGCSLQETDKDALMQKLWYYADQTEDDKYVMWNMEDVQITLKAGNIMIMRSGELYFPFADWMRNTEEYWNATATYKNQRVNPVDFIRMHRKVTGGD